MFLEDFLGMVKTMGTALVVFPLIAILECNAVAKAFGVTRAAVQQWVKTGKVPDARRWQYEAGKVARPR